MIQIPETGFSPAENRRMFALALAVQDQRANPLVIDEARRYRNEDTVLKMETLAVLYRASQYAQFLEKGTPTKEEKV